MTSGTITRDRRTAVVDDYGSPGRIGSYYQRTWSGDDAARSVKGQKPFRIELVKVRDAIPARVVSRTSYQKVPYRDPKGRLRFKRVAVTTRTLVQAKPAKYRKRRVYEAVPNPGTPRRQLPDHPYTTSVQKSNQALALRIQTDKVAEYAYDPSTGGFTRFVGWKYPVTTKNVLSLSSPQPFEPGSWSNNDQISLIGQLREKVAGSDFNFGVFLAEASESLGTITSAATRLAKAFSLLKKGRFSAASWALLPNGGGPERRAFGPGRKAKPLSRELSGQWLELQYGWLPLLKDIEGAAQFIAWLQSAPIQQSYRVGKRKVFRRVSNPNWKSTGLKVETSQIIARIKTIDYVGLSGLKDPLSVAWERLPFSFVADWVLPVGNFLQARALAQALSATYVSTRTTRITDQGATYESPPGEWPRVVYTNGGYTSEDFSMTRTVSGTLDVPLPNVKSLSEAFSWKRATNAVALVVQIFTGKR